MDVNEGRALCGIQITLAGVKYMLLQNVIEEHWVSNAGHSLVLICIGSCPEESYEELGDWKVKQSSSAR